MNDHYYTAGDGTLRRKHDVFGGPHDEPPKENTLTTTRVKYTYAGLRTYLNEHGTPGDSAHGEGLTAELPEIGVTVHDHPHSGTRRELHVMVSGVKVAEVGPADDSDVAVGEHDDNVSGYVDFLAEWAGQSVMDEQYGRIKLKIALDNDLVPDMDYARQRALRAWGPHPADTTTVYEGFSAGWHAAVAFMTR
jgi:hypothetical protein